MPLAILQHTPVWVYALLLALIALGVSQAFTRSMSLLRSALLPLALLGLSLAGVLSSFGRQPLALLAWAGGLAAVVATLHGRFDTSAVRCDAATRSLRVPGSWLPLVLLMLVFGLKFAVGVALAMHPDLHTHVAFALSTSAAYGLFSGVFLSRAIALWTVTRNAAPSLRATA